MYAMITISLVAATVASSLPAFGSNGDANAVIGQPRQTALAETALRLAAILNSEAIIIGDEKSDEKAAKLMAQLFGTNEEMKAAESDYPGIGKELADAVLPIINGYMRARLPQLHETQAALYTRTFSSSELETLIAFYSSPTGQKVIQLMIASLKPKAMLAEAQASEDFKITSSSALSDIRDTVPVILAGLGPEDQFVLEKFGRSGLVDRMKAVAPETQTIALEWMAEYASGEEAETDMIVQAVFAKRENTAE